MKLATLHLGTAEEACVLLTPGFVPVCAVARLLQHAWPHDLLGLLETGSLEALRAWHDGLGSARAVPAALADEVISVAAARYAPLYRRPRKIWGIGLNYRAHAADLNEKSPTLEPASFMKPDTTIIGPGDTILLPVMSQKTTGEAELGLIFGRTCRHVPQGDWRSVVAGFCTIIDMTAEDILRRNPRNLTQSKSFDTFFSFGPLFLTTDEMPDVNALVVRTVINGRVFAENTVANMTFPPDFLVAYHTQIMTMLPGDIISSGTPGAAPLAHGDVVECHVDGFFPLSNPVVDLKPAGATANSPSS
jgi:2-keto-4-pentenoate hydratase/2-oxohepta-3-ene-1,7-dioic acid hydratase in catechol pathway